MRLLFMLALAVMVSGSTLLALQQEKIEKRTLESEVAGLKARTKALENVVHQIRLAGETRPQRGWFRDPIENDPFIAEKINEAKKVAHEKVEHKGLGRIHAIWSVTKQELKDRHGIDWRTPAEMNPDRKFD